MKRLQKLKQLCVNLKEYNMKTITLILLISMLNGSPIQTVQSDSTVIVSAEEVKKKKKKKGKKLSEKGKKKKKGFFSKVFGSK